MKHIFIVNSKAGKPGFAAKLREELAAIPDLDYYVFNTRRSGSEGELVKMIQDFFEGEKLRFYCCGGSGTMRNILNGFDSLEGVEIAFYPCGLTNDFIKTFGDNAKHFKDIRKLINGKIYQVDYMKSNCGVMLNTFSLGLDTASTIQVMEDFRFLKVFHDNLPYTLGLIWALISGRMQKYIIEADDFKYEGGVTELFFGNGNVMGGNLYFFESADTRDGLAGLRVADPRPSLTCLPIMLALINRNYKSVDKISTKLLSSYLKIRRADGGEVLANQDGELIRGVNEWTVEIVPRGLSLIVPEEVQP